MDINSESSSSTSTSTHVKPPSTIQVDQWFDDVQLNRSSSLIGKNLKSFAQIFKLIALKITNGYSSTLSSNIQKSFFPVRSTVPSSVNNQPQFVSTIIPTMSSINLDRTLYEELKPSKFAMSQLNLTPLGNPANTASNLVGANATATPIAASSVGGSLLSSLLNPTVLTEVVLDLHSTHSTSSPHTQMLPQQQAQILTNYNQYPSINLNNPTDLLDNSINKNNHHLK